MTDGPSTITSRCYYDSILQFAWMTTVVLFTPVMCLAQAGQVSYQGELKKDGSLYTGTANMKFAIVSGGQTLWSNDGTSSAGSQPTASVQVTADRGIFSAQLGGSPMQPVLAASLQGATDAALRVWVDTGQGFEQLSDQPISSSAFCLSSEKVQHIYTDVNGNVGIGTSTPAGTLRVNGTIMVGDPQQAPLQFSSTSAWVDFHPTTADGLDTKGLRFGGGGDVINNRGAFAEFYGNENLYEPGNLLLHGGAGGIRLLTQEQDRLAIGASGNVGIGTSSPTAHLEVVGPSKISGSSSQLQFEPGANPYSDVTVVGSQNDKTLRLSGGGDALSNYGARVELQGINAGANATVFAANGGAILLQNGNVGVGTTTPQAKLHIDPGGTTANLKLAGSEIADNYDSRLHIRSGGNIVTLDGGDNVGIGTAAPGLPLSVSGGMDVDHDGANTGTANNALRFGASSSGEGIGSKRTGTGNQYGLDFYTNSANRVSITNGGNVGIGTTAPIAKLNIVGGIHIQGATQDISWPPGENLVLGSYDGSTFTQRMRIDTNGNVSIGVATPQAMLHVAGTTRTGIMEINSGSDLAEPFPIAAAEHAKPGTVMIIDPEHPGQLRISTEAYDRKIAGVVSGAGGIQPGLIMRQEGTVADGGAPVALSGRVYCWCDAESGGPINPGDSLTTSPTLGHAMRVGDHARAQGAILGKAMSRLASDKGLVLVLVSLQ